MQRLDDLRSAAGSPAPLSPGQSDAGEPFALRVSRLVIAKPRAHAGLARKGSRRKSAGMLLKCVLIAGLVAIILFAHGCHGNEDNELFNTWMDWGAK